MNVLWYVLRVFYMLGLIVVIPVVLIASFNFGRDPEVASAVLVAGGVYLFLGYAMFWLLPKFFRSQLDKIVGQVAPSFRPDFSVYSSALDSYMGVDRQAGTVVYVSRGDGVRAQLDIPEILEWEVESAGRKPAALILKTALAELPLVGFRFNARYCDSLVANLSAAIR